MIRLDAEVVVVGAGPAGAVTALLLAMAGRDVVMLDRADFPRPKPCGDCLSAETGLLLGRLGLLERVRACRPAKLAGWRIHAPAGHSFEVRFRDIQDSRDSPDSALSLPRERLDSVLVDAAVEAGVRFVPGAHVTEPLAGGPGVAGRMRAGDPFRARARLVVAADGLRSVLVRRHGLLRRSPRLRKVSLTAHVTGVRADPALGQMHVADGLCAGVAAVTSAESGEASWNLTLVADADRFGRELGAEPHAFFVRALERFPALRECVDGEELRAARLLGSGPFDAPVQRPIADGLALVGDAAGYFDPFTGQGIHHAMAAAELLAPVADAALRRRGGSVVAGDLAVYARERARLLRGSRALQRVVDEVLRRPALADAAIRRLARSPAAARALIAATGDVVPPAALLSPRVLASLLVPSVARSA
jgi:flavin-dependent dehydrogenase